MVRSNLKIEVNPFRYGREADVLVDRTDELRRVVRVGENCGTLFLIGPRRFGKTSILKAAEGALVSSGIVVLRYDAEAYENVGLLASALLTGALRKYSSALDRAEMVARKFFSALKPSLSLDAADGKVTVSMGLEPAKSRAEVPLLTDVLNGIEQLAKADGRRALVVLDEFQQIVTEAGNKAEKQIRAAVQTHHHVGYVFAGSSTRMMTDMIANSARAFWHLGDQLYLGPIPREAFLPFLRKGLESSGASIEEPALDRILDLSEDVPYNAQQLSSECWVRLREEGGARLTVPGVDRALRAVVATQHVAYLQRWLSLTLAQKRTLKILIVEPGQVNLSDASRRHGLPRSSIQRALEVLEAKHFVRQHFSGASARWKLEDPFMRTWLTELQAQ